MKKLSFLLLLFLLKINGIAQTQRFIYEYEFAPDSNKTDVLKKELMALDIDAKGSTFQSYRTLKIDSLKKSMFNGSFTSLNIGGSGMKDLASMMDNNIISYKIVKEYPTYDTYFYDMVGVDMYKVKEDKKPEWIISSEKNKIAGYEVQKATIEFGGRKWSAWFTKEIPIPDGPYKFSGLPGLIVKIEDDSHTHSMILVGNSKVPTEDTKIISPNYKPYSKEISVTKDQFRKAWIQYIQYPAKSMMAQKVRMFNDNKEITSNTEMEQSITKRVKEKQSQNNNKIEPNLYK